jgi:ribosomal protection tetracycline resistance protein
VRNLNLGVVAHVDAGKTTLTERLLYAAGVIDEVGSVDRGSTQTDSLALERQRGITIKSAVVSFESHGVRVNLIDTPGHPDFIAEVERALGVLDGAVLVVSAVEGVQAQTRILMRALQRLAVPTLIFVNKIDRTGARHQSLLDGLRDRLTPATLAMGRPHSIGTRAATCEPFAWSDPSFAALVAERLADHDERLLAAYVAGEAVPSTTYADRLAQQVRGCLVHPVFFGSALTGAGVDDLMAALPMLAPPNREDEREAVSAAVFKVERGPSGERIAYVRVRTGLIRARDVVAIAGRRPKVTGIRVFESGRAATAASVGAGRIAVLAGLGDVRIGDLIGADASPHAAEQSFAPPTLESVISPVRTEDRGRLHVALTQLAEQDPLIGLREDGLRGQTHLSLYGEVQKEVIAATLAADFGVEVQFHDSVTICIERPSGTGTAVEAIKVGDNPFLATVGLRVEPAAIGSGVSFGLDVELGAMPFAFFRAVEESVRETLAQGLLGWEVHDVAVVMTRSGYWPRQSRMHGTFDKSVSSTAGDFRGVTPLVLMDALRRAGTDVYEPVIRFRLDVPEHALPTVTAALGRLRAVPHATTSSGRGFVVEGLMPAANVHALRRELPAATSGEGVLEGSFDGYQRVVGKRPRRARWGHDPMDRKRYLLAVTRQRLVEAGLA